MIALFHSLFFLLLAASIRTEGEKLKASSLMPFLFIDTPFKGTLERGIVVPISEELPAEPMKSPGMRFTVARVITNACPDEYSSPYWSGVLIEIYDRNTNKRIFAHQFKDSKAISLETMKSHNVIEPLSYTELKTAFTWKAPISDVVRNVESRDYGMIAYTIVLPFDDRIQSVQIEVTPVIKDSLIYPRSFKSQAIIVKRPLGYRHKQFQSFRGLFKKVPAHDNKDGVHDDGYLFVPALPGALLEKSHLTHDVIVESHERNDFTIGVWHPEENRKWMRLSVYQFQPLGKEIFGGINALQVWLEGVDTKFKVKLETFLNSKVPEFDGETDCHEYTNADYEKKKPMDGHTGHRLAEKTPPSWAKVHHISGLHVVAVAFHMKSNMHGGILNYDFQNQPGHVYAYSFWINFPVNFQKGRYQFRFLNGVQVNPRNQNGLFKPTRETFTDDFFVSPKILVDDRNDFYDYYGREVGTVLPLAPSKPQTRQSGPVSSRPIRSRKPSGPSRPSGVEELPVGPSGPDNDIVMIELITMTQRMGQSKCEGKFVEDYRSVVSSVQSEKTFFETERQRLQFKPQFVFLTDLPSFKIPFNSKRPEKELPSNLNWREQYEYADALEERAVPAVEDDALWDYNNNLPLQNIVVSSPSNDFVACSSRSDHEGSDPECSDVEEVEELAEPEPAEIEVVDEDDDGRDVKECLVESGKIRDLCPGQKRENTQCDPLTPIPESGSIELMPGRTTRAAPVGEIVR